MSPLCTTPLFHHAYPQFYDDSVHVLHTVPKFSPLCTRLALEHLLMDGRRRKEGWLMLCKIASFGEALECGVVSSSRFVRKPLKKSQVAHMVVLSFSFNYSQLCTLA